MRRRFQVLSIAVALQMAIVFAGPVSAITFGEADGNSHPNVGSIVVDVPELGLELLQWCSGTLISDRVFLTASHCVDRFDVLTEVYPTLTVRVTFDSTISAGGTFYTGAWHVNPGFNGFTGKGGMSDPGDIAVIVLDESPGITPAQLPTAGLLDQLSKSKVLKNTMFTAVGYGSTRDTMTHGFDAIDNENVDRNQVQQRFFSLTGSWITLSMVNTPGHRSGGTCYGDSGGPHFIHLNGSETDIVTSITVTGDATCKATDKTYRTDTPSARTFLADFVTLP
jgi:secreted trypsin-like serine protease